MFNAAKSSSARYLAMNSASALATVGRESLTTRGGQRRRVASTYLQERAKTIYSDLRHNGHLAPDPGKEMQLATRRAVDRGWREVALMLAATGDQELAERVQRFVDEMPRPRTGVEVLRQQILWRTTRTIEPEARTR
jgi:hypothetical protein